jgi:hypothetical protein
MSVLPPQREHVRRRLSAVGVALGLSVAVTALTPATASPSPAQRAVIVLSADPTLAAVCRSERHAPALLVRYGGQRWRVLRGRPPAGAGALVRACAQAP